MVAANEGKKMKIDYTETIAAIAVAKDNFQRSSFQTPTHVILHTDTIKALKRECDKLSANYANLIEIGMTVLGLKIIPSNEIEPNKFAVLILRRLNNESGVVPPPSQEVP